MTPETIDQYRSFIDGLFERTKQRKLKWSIYDDLTIETEIDGIPISLSEIKPDGERKSTDYAIGIYTHILQVSR